MIRLREAFGSLHRDERGVLFSFIVKAVIVFAILALAVEETGQVIKAQVNAEDAARAGALAAANAYQSTQNLKIAEQTAQQTMTSLGTGAKLVAFKLVGNGQAVTVTARVTAHTMLISRVGFLKHLGQQTASDEETPNTA